MGKKRAIRMVDTGQEEVETMYLLREKVSKENVERTEKELEELEKE